MMDIIKKCHNNCINCYGPGNETNNNCKECKSNLKLFNEYQDIYNCYKICPFYYYFDKSNNYICTKTNNCPDNFNKVILPKLKCIDKCKNDFIYKYEFNTKFCLNECPKGTFYNEMEEICQINIKNKTNNENTEANDFMVSYIQESISEGYFDDIINNIIDNKEDYVQISNNMVYQITTSDN